MSSSRKLVVAHGLAVFVARGDEEREHVVATGRPLLSAPMDFVERELVALGALPNGAAPGAPRAEIDAHRGYEERRPRDDVERLGDRVPNRFFARSAVDAEHVADDDVERDLVESPMQAERLAQREAVDDLVSEIDHDVPVFRHALTVEGREEQTALPEVFLLVDHEVALVAEERGQGFVELAREEIVAVVGEDLFLTTLGGCEKTAIGGSCGRRKVNASP